MQIANIINHVAVVADESSSMNSHRTTLPKVLDAQTASLAEFSKKLDQETRVSIYTFNSRGTVNCVHFDKDVLRLPSMVGHYSPKGMTSLVDSTLKAIEDLEKTAQMYGDHSFLIYVLTDGMNNDNFNIPETLRKKIASLPGNWTLACLVPDKMGVLHAQKFGFPEDNIQIWDATTTAGVTNVGEVIRKTTETYMQNRARGIRGTTSLFKLNVVSGKDIQQNLSPVYRDSYHLLYVPQDGRIDEFITSKLNRPYKIGEGYYELTKTETIQPQKNIAVLWMGQIYTGKNARSMLGLPDYNVKVKPSDYTDYRIFVQSTSLNRKLIAGTNLLVMR